MGNIEKEEMSLIKETKYILEKLGHNPRKRFGQNFLISKNVLEKIILESGITKEDLVIEIGPGIGSLTKYLLESAGKVIAVEIDNDLASFLNERFSYYSNFSLINEDILKLDLSEVLEKEGYKRENVKIVANLPYYITTPIILSLFDLDIESITVMVQKEVAERFTVKDLSKKRSNITYIIEYNSDAEILFDVSKNNFMPAPKVDSSIINLKLKTKKEKENFLKRNILELKKQNIILKNEENILDTEIVSEINLLEIKNLAFDIIKNGFMHKRKKLISAIMLSKKYDKEKLEKIFNILNISLDIRAEKLTLNEYIKIAILYLFLSE